MTEWTHNGLAADLADYLRSAERMVWLDMQLGPSGSPRPDVFTLQRSYSKPRPTAFEIKVSRSDLRSDTTSGKWQAYLKFAGSVTFAVPEGLCSPADIPAGCGLIVRKKEVWRYVRKATVHPVDLPMDACMKLLIDGVSRVTEARVPVPRKIELWDECDAVRKKFGQEVARCARDIVAAQKRLEDARALANGEWDQMRAQVERTKAVLIAQAKSEHETWTAIRAEIADWLELGDDLSTWAVKRRIVALKTACDADARVEKADNDLRRARLSLEQALSVIGPQSAAV